MKKQILGLFLIVAFVILAACANISGENGADGSQNAEQISPILLKIGHEVTEDNALHIALLDFAEAVELASEGRFQVELYPYFELGDAAELVALTAAGTIQMCLPLSSDLAALPPDSYDNYPLDIPASWQIWGAMDGFYLYPDLGSACAAVDGELGADMAASLADLDGIPLLCLGFAYDGQLCIGSAGSGITAPSDISNRKIALSGSDAWLNEYKNARPQALPISEFYPSLLRKQLALYQATPANIATMYLDDHSSALTLSEHAYAFRPLLVNRSWYAALSDEDMGLLRSAIDIFLADQRQLAADQHVQSIEDLRNRGMDIIELTPEQEAAWQ